VAGLIFLTLTELRELAREYYDWRTAAGHSHY